MERVFSEKQMKSYRESSARINIWEGAVRSGKSFISILRLLKAIKYGPPGLGMIVGVSRESIQRNTLTELCGLIGLPMPSPKTNSINLLNRQIYLVGANDERAQRKIQGSTLALAYVDEATLIPEGFWRMLLSRLSVTSAQLFATSNPDSPFHWLKADYLDKEDLDLNRWSFRLEDNPSLGQDYINSLKKEYSGLWYQRYIEGLWVLADGVVYDSFDEKLHVIDAPPGAAKHYIVGVDYGTTNPTAFLLIGVNMDLHPNVWVEKEYYYDSRKEHRQKTDSEYSEDLEAFIKGRNVKSIYIDPSAASFQLECKRLGIRQIRNAENDVLNGIRFVSQTISNGMVKICRSCPNLIREFGSYCWDSKASERGEDKPIKEHDHCFTGDTLILTDQGEKPIKNVVKGDTVWTRKGWKPVFGTWQSKEPRLVKEYSFSSTSFWATENHKVITNTGEKRLSDLTDRDWLDYVRSFPENKKQVEGVEPTRIRTGFNFLESVGAIEKNETVYNLTIEDCNEYVANRILVANCADALRYGLFSHLGLGNRLITPEEINNIYDKARGIDSNIPGVFQPNSANFY